MSVFRFSCNALARRICLSKPRIEHTLPSPILELLIPRRISRQHCRPFSHASRLCANVIDPPQNAPAPPTPKRTVRIGHLPDGRVDDGTIHRIFGRKLSPSEGNNVLRIIHHRRTAGSLADHGVDNLGKQYTHVHRDIAMRGLEWLREKYPIDEARAAEEWAEKEANRISYELWLADPETESKYKDPARAFREQMQKEEEEKKQQEIENQKIGILHVGKSQFERNIEEKRKERLEEVAKKAEEKERQEKEMEAKLSSGEWVKTPSGTQLMRPDQTTYVDVFGREQISRRKEEAAKYAKAAQVTTAQSTEELLAQTTLVSLYIICCGITSQHPIIHQWGCLTETTGPAPLAHDQLRSLRPRRILGIRPLLHTTIRQLPTLPLLLAHHRHNRRTRRNQRRNRNSMAHHAPLAIPHPLLHARTRLPTRRAIHPQRLQPRAIRALPRQHGAPLPRRTRLP